MRKLVIGVVTSSWLSLVLAQPEGHLHHSADKPVSPADAPINITINPEVRVSVSRGGALPPGVPCGSPMELAVRIINQGFLTAPLRANLVDPAPDNLRMEFSGQPLKGLPEERRFLRITLTEPGPVDVTIAFGAKGEVGDLNGRDRIHLLLSCGTQP